MCCTMLHSSRLTAASTCCVLSSMSIAGCSAAVAVSYVRWHVPLPSPSDLPDVVMTEVCVGPIETGSVWKMRICRLRSCALRFGVAARRARCHTSPAHLVPLGAQLPGGRISHASM